MAKTKLITIPIEEEKRERLNKYCADKGSTVSQTLTKYIDLLLDGHIDDDDHLDHRPGPIDLDHLVDLAVAKIKPIITDQIYTVTSEVSKQLKENTEDIFDLTNNIIQCQRAIEQFKVAFKANNSNESISDIKLESSLAVDRPPQPTPKPPSDNEVHIDTQEKTLEDTRLYIDSRMEYNRTRVAKSDKDTNVKIANYLREHNYPHPDGKQWHRNYIPEVCKLWKIKIH